DVMSNAFQQSQLSRGIFSTQTVSVGDLFIGAMLPGLLLVLLYTLYMLGVARFRPALAPPASETELAALDANGSSILGALLPPLLLIVAVLGSILSGAATPTEAAGVGAFGALLLALAKRQLNWR